jgi:hypothetical protein
MKHITFATGAAEVLDAEAIYMQGRSIRDFGGGLKDAGLHVYIPELYFDDWQPLGQELTKAGIILHMYKAAKEELSFIYSFKPRAAMAAEHDIGGGTVVWMDRHSLVTGCCADFLLNPWERFAYRPVNIRNIGSLYGGPLSGFWRDAYDIAGVTENMLFPICSSVDRQKINPYFFACLFVFRPEDGLMSAWNEMFAALRDHERMEEHFRNEDNRVFLHQAALCLTVLKNVPKAAMRELPYYYGYPVHLHTEIAAPYMAGSMDQLNTAFFYRELHDWREAAGQMAISEKLGEWLTERIAEAKAMYRE